MSIVPSSKRPVGRLSWRQVVLLSIPCLAVLAVPLYNRADPTIWGVPFFYWWQIVWVPLSSVFLYFVYRAVRRP